MLTIALALGGVVVWGFCDLLIAQFTRRAATVTAIAVTTLASFALALPLALAVGGLPEGAGEWRAAGYAAVGGIFYIAAYGALVAALSRGDLSVVAPLAALDGAFGAILAIALGDPVDWITAAGLTLAAFGGALAAAAPRSVHEAAASRATPGVDPASVVVADDPPERRRLVAGAGYALLSGLAIAIALQFFGHTDEVPATTTVAVARTVGLAMIVPVALATTGLMVPRRLWPAVLLIAVTDVAGFVFVAAATARGPVSVVAVVVAQVALMGLALGLLVLHERPAPRQLVGAAAAIAGVTVLALAA